MAWCMVGTAVYQVGRASSIQAKNFSALKPGVQKTCEPAASGASTPAIRPWMWKSGMMFSPRSAAVNCSVRAMWVAEAARLRCESGTIFGLEVVPEVCSSIEMSSGSAMPPCAAGVPPSPSRATRRNSPAGAPSSTTRSIRRTPSLVATSMAGEVLEASTISALALRSER